MQSIGDIETPVSRGKGDKTRSIFRGGADMRNISYAVSFPIIFILVAGEGWLRVGCTAGSIYTSGYAEVCHTDELYEAAGTGHALLESV